jgi:hypothetical protein
LRTLQYVSALIKAITEFFPDSPILGTTTAGEIMDGAALDRTTVISFAAGSQATATI